jgi:hypothetical protein
MRISNTKASRTAAEREEYHRISALLDQALELTFPCSDPVAITFSGYDVFRPEAATAPEPPIRLRRAFEYRATAIGDPHQSPKYE